MNSETKYLISAGFIVVLMLVIIGFGPILTLMAINTIFNLGVAYNISTYLSVMWLNLTTFGGLGLAIRNLKN